MFKTISAALLATAMLAAPALAATTKAPVAAKPAATVGMTTQAKGVATPAKPVIAKPAVKEVRHARLHRSHKMTKHVARAFHRGRISTAKASIKPMPKSVIKHKV